MNKYEQLIEHIINDETDKARELFHTIVVEKSRDIYESLIDEQDLEEVGGNEVEGLARDVQMDEEGISEEEESEEGDELGALDSEESEEGEFDGEEHEEAEIEDRVVDLESALDELKAEFDALMAGEEHEEEAMPGIHGDEGSEEMGGEEEQSEFFEAKEEDEDDEEDEEVDESIVREYVEKVAAPSNKTEGGEVGKGSSTAVNKGSIVAGKNDMGGTSANIVKGGEEKGSTAKKPQVNNAGNINVPGGKAGSAFKTKEKARAGEGQTTDGKLSVATKSPLAK
jgi:hypothetical protein